jgi:hypothetical protein
MEIVSYFLGKIVDYLPAFMLTLMFPSKKVARQVEIRLRGNNPICLNLGAEVPCVDLYFEIINLSYFNLVLDRLLIDFWFGQPTFQGAVLRRYNISAGKTVEDISYKQGLTTAQQKQIEQYNNNSMTHGRVSSLQPPVTPAVRQPLTLNLLHTR